MVRRGRGEIGKAVVTNVPVMSNTSSAATPAATTSVISNLTTPPLQQRSGGIPDTSTKLASCVDHASGPGVRVGKIASNGAGDSGPDASSRPYHPPPPPSRKTPSGRAEDGDDGMREFEIALIKCQEGDETHYAALRSAFAVVVDKAVAARERREVLEDRCNRLAAENQAVMSELANQRAAAARAQAAKQRIEKLCREQAQANQRTVEQAKVAAAEEQMRMAELREKFETAVPSIEEKLSVEAKLRKAQREDNEVLRAKLTEFAEQTRQSDERFAAQLRPGCLRIQIAKAECHQQEAAKRAIDSRTQILRADLERARQSHAKIKKDTVEREKFLSKVQGVWNERKKTAAELEAKVKELRASEKQLQASFPVVREAAAKQEALVSLEKLVGRLKGLCTQLELDVEAKQAEAGGASLPQLPPLPQMPQEVDTAGGTALTMAVESHLCLEGHEQEQGQEQEQVQL